MENETPEVLETEAVNLKSEIKAGFKLPQVSDLIVLEQDPDLVFDLHGTVTWRCVGSVSA
jgi:hypothetical protein